MLTGASTQGGAIIMINGPANDECKTSSDSTRWEEPRLRYLDEFGLSVVLGCEIK